jgi:hypothetical protein
MKRTKRAKISHKAKAEPRPSTKRASREIVSKEEEPEERKEEDLDEQPHEDDSEED